MKKNVLIVSLCAHALSEDEFVAPLARVVGKCIILHYTKVQKKDVARASHIVLSGTPVQDNAYLDNVQESFAWLKTVTIPVLGICAGMQVIGVLFGGKIVQQSRIGMTTITVQPNELMPQKSLDVYQLHQYSATLPKEFAALSRTGAQINVFNRKNFWGVIFHPEVRHEEILRNFIANLAKVQ